MRCKPTYPTVMFAFVFLLIMIFPAAGFPGQPLSQSAEQEILTKIEAMDIGEVAIDLNARISVPDKPEAGIQSADLFATVVRKTNSQDDSGEIARPTIVVATPYRREIMTILYLPLLRHDYNLLVYDVRGSGSSYGSWISFGPAEHYDAAYVVDQYIPSQAWSDGRVGMIGPSYMAISQMLAAGQIETDTDGDPVHLKALFPLVTMSDSYRDIVMHGGNVDIEFIPIWLGGVDLLGALPPMLLAGQETPGRPDLNDIEESFQIWREHLQNIPVTIDWIMDGGNINKNDFYDTKSPMIYWPDKPAGGWQFGSSYPPELGTTVIPDSLPVFLTGGWFDLFTRGTLNTYQYGLKDHDKSDKAMMIGPWYHLGGSLGLGVNGILNCEIPARWFDWKIKGESDPFMEEYPVLVYVMGKQKWRAEQDWPLPEYRTEDHTLFLSKRKAPAIRGDWFSVLNAKNNYRLVENPLVKDYFNKFLWFQVHKDAPVLEHDPQSLHGINSRSSTRWLAGAPALVSQVSKLINDKDIDRFMPWEDERNDEVGVLTFTTEKLEEDLEITGPIKLTFWAKTEFTRPLRQAALDGVLNTIESRFNLENNMVVELMKKDDVQWVVELNDVFPDGRARNITSGWLSADNRPYNPNYPRQVDPAYTAFDPYYDHAYRKPDPIEEGSVYKYVIELWPTDNVFKKDHRIRLSISASDFPHLFPVLQPSENQLIIDQKHPAKIEFQTVTQGGDYKWIDDIDNYMLSHSN